MNDSRKNLGDLTEKMKDIAFASHWTKDLDRWFEQGIDTPGLTLINVTAERAHYRDGYKAGETKVSAGSEVAA